LYVRLADIMVAFGGYWTDVKLPDRGDGENCVANPYPATIEITAVSPRRGITEPVGLADLLE
jgi:hypothetical protein